MKKKHTNLITPSSTVNFADVAHQTLIFDSSIPAERLVLELADSRWMQRLRRISQTGNTKLVYMFAEHSRFGHSLGVAYLAMLLMKNLKKRSFEQVLPYEHAVLAAAILHDVGHVAPGSHLGERIWATDSLGRHEHVSIRVVTEDEEIRDILERAQPGLAEMVTDILSDNPRVPSWTRSIISGGGWNADRGNWAIVDSAMCSVSYGRYNVTALIDAFCLSEQGELVLQEARSDALTHFFVARDSMYRQVYQHRVLQAVDALSSNVVRRVRDIIDEHTAQSNPGILKILFEDLQIYCDDTMRDVLLSRRYGSELPLQTIFEMTESWWQYHIERWSDSKDQILSDLSSRLRDRRLFKTIRLEEGAGHAIDAGTMAKLVEDAKEIAIALGYDPKYYVNIVQEKDKHRGKTEEPPMVLLDNGEIVPVTVIEPIIDQILKRTATTRSWLAVPKSVKEKLGRHR